MPGIVGLITRMPREQAVTQLLQMVDSVCHESFYAKGTWIDEFAGVYVGWTARQGSFSDGMPLQNDKKDVTLIFSGDDFSEVRACSRLKGAVDDMGRPSMHSYLTRLYEDDPRFPASLNGKFHGVISDQRTGACLLFNDRYSMHRLYYHESEEAFYFAAEAKAILAVCPGLRALDPRGLAEFVSTGAVLEGRTLFKDIEVLPGASLWRFRNARLTSKGSYFNATEWETQQPLDAEAYYQEVRATFSQILPRHFAGTEQIGMSLTGGLDTRMILACRASAPGSLPCYTFGSPLRENEDVRIARRVAELCQQPHQVLAAGDDFLRQFPAYAERAVYLSDGCVDVGRAPDLYLNQKARNIAPVRMTGNYGGEILRAVRALNPMKVPAGLFERDFLTHIQKAIETQRRTASGHPVAFAAFKQIPAYLYGILALEQTQLEMRSPFLDNDFVKTVFRSPLAELASTRVSMRLIADGNSALLGVPTDRGLGGNRGWMAEAASRTVLEFLFKAEYAYDMGMPQWLARLDRVFSPLRLERLFLGRHKVFHFRVWYRDALAGFVEETLLDPRSLSRPHVERKGIERVVRDHIQGRGNYTTEIHKLLTVELLYRLFIDHNNGGAFRPRVSDSLASRLDHLATA